ncbi:hypothetical protein [Stenotrophomonas sp. PSU-St19]
MALAAGLRSDRSNPAGQPYVERNTARFRFALQQMRRAKQHF